MLLVYVLITLITFFLQKTDFFGFFPEFGNFTLGSLETEKTRKWPYLSLWVKNQKNKGTFFSPTFKVREKKVGLFFQFLTCMTRYGHFMLIFGLNWTKLA